MMEIILTEPGHSRRKKYHQIVKGHTDVNGVEVLPVSLPWKTWNAAAAATKRKKESGWMVEKDKEGNNKLYIIEGKKGMKEVLPVENHISIFTKCYFANFGAGATFDKNNLKDMKSTMSGAYYFNATLFFDEFLLADLPPTVTTTQVALVEQNSRGEPKGANAADATLNQYMSAASAAGTTGPSINYYGPVQVVHGNNVVKNSHSQVADAKVLERILHLGEINVDISKDISKNVRNLEDNIASSVKKPASTPPKIDLDEVRTGNLFGAGRAQLEDEYTNRLVGRDPSPVSPRLAHVGLDDIFDSDGSGDEERDDNNDDYKEDEEYNDEQSSNDESNGESNVGEKSSSSSWYSYFKSSVFGK